MNTRQQQAHNRYTQNADSIAQQIDRTMRKVLSTYKCTINTKTGRHCRE